MDMDIASGSGDDLAMKFASGAELEDVPQAVRNKDRLMAEKAVKGGGQAATEKVGLQFRPKMEVNKGEIDD